jgi:hypothetical protein
LYLIAAALRRYFVSTSTGAKQPRKLSSVVKKIVSFEVLLLTNLFIGFFAYSTMRQMVWCRMLLAQRAEPDRCRPDLLVSFRRIKKEERASDLDSEALFRDTGLGT